MSIQPTSHPPILVEPIIDGTTQAVASYLPVSYLIDRLFDVIDRDPALKAELRIWVRNENPRRRRVAASEIRTDPRVRAAFVLVDLIDAAERLGRRYDVATVTYDVCPCGSELVIDGDLGPACREHADDQAARARRAGRWSVQR